MWRDIFCYERILFYQRIRTNPVTRGHPNVRCNPHFVFYHSREELRFYCLCCTMSANCYRGSVGGDKEWRNEDIVPNSRFLSNVTLGIDGRTITNCTVPFTTTESSEDCVVSDPRMWSQNCVGADDGIVSYHAILIHSTAILENYVVTDYDPRANA